MTPAHLYAAITLVVVGFVMLVTHEVADHWVQTSWQAGNKGLHGTEKWTGRRACAQHVASYTFCTALAVGVMWWCFGLHISWTGFILGQAVSAITHYWADRRSTLQGLAEKLGSGGFYRLGAPRKSLDENGELLLDENGKPKLDENGMPYDDNPSLGTGAYALDQSWHKLWILIAAVITALV